MTAAAVLAQEVVEQAPVTALPERIALTLIVLGVTVLATWAMWRNWRRRIARQDWVHLPEPPDAGFDGRNVFPARYVASVTTENWLDRIAAEGLGMPGRAEVAVGDTGVLIRREGEQALFLPTGLIEEVATVRGMAQEVYERDGLVAITWRSGGGRITTGLRMAQADDHAALVRTVSDMIGKAEV